MKIVAQVSIRRICKLLVEFYSLKIEFEYSMKREYANKATLKP